MSDVLYDRKIWTVTKTIDGELRHIVFCIACFVFNVIVTDEWRRHATTIVLCYVVS